MRRLPSASTWSDCWNCVSFTQDYDAFDSSVGQSTTIAYTYDPLYRLTNAHYSSGPYSDLGYQYDQVGNRIVETRMLGGTGQEGFFAYDASNRMLGYTWDNNGNLVDTGKATYRYDRANRLISATVEGVTSLYAYNGDGVRLRQVVAGVPTTYTQDLVAPLPVVLQAQTGANTTQYLYTLGTRPLAQNGGAWEYLLADALGSVRQIVDANPTPLRYGDYAEADTFCMHTVFVKALTRAVLRGIITRR